MNELTELADQFLKACLAKGIMAATAESCTGGMIVAHLTDIAGSSAVVDRGFVTYSNDAKLAILKVSTDVLETFGSVSVAVAWSMAQGALEASGADVAVAITGIAGPDGGSEKKPVGTVVFARAERAADPQHVVADARQFEDNGRGGVRLQAALCALELLMPEASESP